MDWGDGRTWHAKSNGPGLCAGFCSFSLFASRCCLLETRLQAWCNCFQPPGKRVYTASTTDRCFLRGQTPDTRRFQTSKAVACRIPPDSRIQIRRLSRPVAAVARAARLRKPRQRSPALPTLRLLPTPAHFLEARFPKGLIRQHSSHRERSWGPAIRFCEFWVRAAWERFTRPGTRNSIALLL